MGLFNRKKEIETIETAKDSLQTEMKDLDKLTVGSDSIEIPELPPELIRLREAATSEAEKITKDMEEPRMLPEPTEGRRDVLSNELPLKELDERIDKELKKMRKKMKDLGDLNKMDLISPEMVTLMDMYTEFKSKLDQFIEDINRMDLSNLTSQKTFAAVYKFRACKGLAEIKREIRKIEITCKRAGFVPSKIREILESRAENLVDSFFQKIPKE
jgi:hypothetical protein